MVARRDSAPPVAPDGAVTDDDAKLEQFTTDALAAPEWILFGDTGNQSPDLGAEMRSPRLMCDFQVQYSRQPFGCQRITVSGRTSRRCCRQPIGPDVMQPDP